MKASTTRRLTLLFFAVAAATSVQAGAINQPPPPPPPPPPSVDTCHVKTVATGAAKDNQGLAQIRAREKWEAAATANCGGAKQKWGNAAKGHDLTCHHSGGSPINRTWFCDATAVPG